MQLSLLPEPPVNECNFVNNMKLPIHRWFRYSAGFSAQWAEAEIGRAISASDSKAFTVLDPFVGSGTTLLAADARNVRSIGIEAHPLVARIAKAKTSWALDLDRFQLFAQKVVRVAEKQIPAVTSMSLLRRIYSEESLQGLLKLRDAWRLCDNNTLESELTWVAITSILRLCSFAGTAPWQYVLPDRRKKKTVEVFAAFNAQVAVIIDDVRFFQGNYTEPRSQIIDGSIIDPGLKVPRKKVDMVLTSPPYANNYDYADAVRIEAMFWGEVEGWAGLHLRYRQNLVCSCSQHASAERYDLEALLSAPELQPIIDSIRNVCVQLSDVRESRGGKKHYHTMIARYFLDMACAWKNLRRMVKPGGIVCFVIGDSAPYGVHVPVEKWLGELALSTGFEDFKFEGVRERNIKWKNRKHRIPLKEGRLWVSA